MFVNVRDKAIESYEKIKEIIKNALVAAVFIPENVYISFNI